MHNSSLAYAETATRPAPRLGNPDTKPIRSGLILEAFASFEIELELPDTVTGDFRIVVDKRTLSVSGSGIEHIELELPAMSTNRLRQSRFYRFILAFLSFGNEHLHAACNDGMLYIHIPKGLTDSAVAHEIATVKRGIK